MRLLHSKPSTSPTGSVEKTLLELATRLAYIPTFGSREPLLSVDAVRELLKGVDGPRHLVPVVGEAIMRTAGFLLSGLVDDEGVIVMWRELAEVGGAKWIE